MLMHALLLFAFASFAFTVGAQGLVWLENPVDPLLSMTQLLTLCWPLDPAGAAGALTQTGKRLGPLVFLLRLPAIGVTAGVFAVALRTAQTRQNAG